MFLLSTVPAYPALPAYSASSRSPAYLAPPASPAYPAPPASPAYPASPALPSAQIPFDQAVADLANPDASIRLRTARMLTDAAYPEAAVPLAKAIGDPQDDVQFQAIAAELNIFLVDKI